MPKKISSGEIQTMADDLELAEQGKQPSGAKVLDPGLSKDESKQDQPEKKISMQDEPQEPQQKPTPPTTQDREQEEPPQPTPTPSPEKPKPPQQPQKQEESSSLEELLPMEGERESAEPEPTETPPIEQEKPPEEEGGPQTEIEKEIFPSAEESTEPSEEKPSGAPKAPPPTGLPKEPETPQETEESPAPPSPREDTEEEKPEETPEELLGIEKGGAEEPPSPPSAPPSPEKPSFYSRYKIFVWSLIIVVLAGAAAGGWYLYSDEGPPQPEEPPQEPTKPEQPDPLIAPDGAINEISIESLDKTLLESKLEGLKEFQGEFPQNNIVYIPIFNENNSSYLDAKTFLDTLGVAQPGGLEDVVNSRFMLYLYSPGDEERVACQNNLVSEEECYGPRLGLVFKAKEGEEENLQRIAEEWEGEIGKANFSALILNDLAEIPGDVLDFNSAVYKSDAVSESPEFNIRYANIPMPKYQNFEGGVLKLSGTAVDIVQHNEFLIIGTSKNSVRAPIDQLLKNK